MSDADDLHDRPNPTPIRTRRRHPDPLAASLDHIIDEMVRDVRRETIARVLRENRFRIAACASDPASAMFANVATEIDQALEPFRTLDAHADSWWWSATADADEKEHPSHVEAGAPGWVIAVGAVVFLVAVLIAVAFAAW